ncbi:M56 family metallopeptidase [Fusibacter sp. 3D3]|uniref:M56 family metallopeptidase n=1 Tax=Fusibacter sp. 3D3 TaxID=1048380 RepID=UPI00085346C7|nr:M56 family metallopeptidase [Fusibacter sp. 3D3]GAU79598.1 regulatory sensor-transducer [Fusibacter sp. 3D3]
MIPRFYKYLLILSVISGVLYFILKLFFPVTIKYFSAKWHYYSYVFLSTVFLIPYSFLLSGVDIHFTNKPLSLIQNELRPIFMSSSNVHIVQGKVESNYSFCYNFDFLFYFLAVGSILFALNILVQNYKLNRRILRICQLVESPSVLNVLLICKQRIGINQKIPVYLSDYISTPFLSGIFHPRIILPNLSFSSEELQYIFMHELTHWKNHDAVFKCLTLVINALHWFNPLAYFIRHDIDRFCEFYCDESVVISMNKSERRQYCELILNVLWHVADHQLKPYSAFSDEKRNIKRRLSLIMKEKKIKNNKLIRILAIAMTFTFMLTGSVVAYAASSENLDVNGNSQFLFNTANKVIIGDIIPTVNYTELNDYDQFIFNENAPVTRSTSVPSSLWSWTSNGSTYNISGSSNSSTLYTNYYFKNVTGKTFNLTAGSSNRLVVDLVHKGVLVQEVVSTWTIDANASKSVKIQTSDLNNFSDSDKYYFRFNSSPIGNSYSVSGSFGL